VRCSLIQFSFWVLIQIDRSCVGCLKHTKNVGFECLFFLAFFGFFLLIDLFISIGDERLFCKDRYFNDARQTTWFKSSPTKLLCNPLQHIRLLSFFSESLSFSLILLDLDPLWQNLSTSFYNISCLSLN